VIVNSIGERFDTGGAICRAIFDKAGGYVHLNMKEIEE